MECYTPLHVILATILGWPLAGGFLLFRNGRKLGYLFLGLVLTVGLSFSLYLLSAPWVYLPFVASLALLGVLAQTQEGVGTPASIIWPLGIGVICLFPVAILNLAIFFFFVWYNAPIDFAYAPHCNICRYNRVSVEDARRLGDGLRKAGYFNGLDDRSVDLLKERNVYHVRVWIDNEGWREPKTVERWAKVAQQLSQGQFRGEPVVVDMMDRTGDCQRSIPSWVRPRGR